MPTLIPQSQVQVDQVNIPAMSLNIRSYNHDEDYDLVNEFLIEVYLPGERLHTWLQPRWEYMHFHSNIESTDRSRIGMFLEDGRLLGVVHFEHSESWLYFQVRPGSEHIKPKMLDYAEKEFGYGNPDAEKHLYIWINDFDSKLGRLAEERGFSQQCDIRETMAQIELNRPLASTSLPDGFTTTSLAEECDMKKVNQILWRGFNHDGPAPESEIPGRRRMKEAPGFKPAQTFVVVAPNGDYISYSGVWYIERNRVAYVEPVATDPNYRRHGFGSAVVQACLRKVRKLGADVAWVGSDQPFYEALGFKQMFHTYAWRKRYEY